MVAYVSTLLPELHTQGVVLLDETRQNDVGIESLSLVALQETTSEINFPRQTWYFSIAQATKTKCMILFIFPIHITNLKAMESLKLSNSQNVLLPNHPPPILHRHAKENPRRSHGSWSPPTNEDSLPPRILRSRRSNHESQRINICHGGRESPDTSGVEEGEAAGSWLLP